MFPHTHRDKLWSLAAIIGCILGLLPAYLTDSFIIMIVLWFFALIEAIHLYVYMKFIN